MNVLLRLNEGFADLSRYDGLKLIERAGHRLLVGEIAGAMVEQVVAFFDHQPEAEADKAAALLDRVWAACGAVEGVIDQLRGWGHKMASVQTLVDARDLTVAPTEQMQADIMIAEQAAEGATSPPPTAPPVPQERLVLRLRRGDSTPKELLLLQGRTVSKVEMAGEAVGIICDEV